MMYQCDIVTILGGAPPIVKSWHSLGELALLRKLKNILEIEIYIRIYYYIF